MIAKKLILSAVERTAITYRFRAEGEGGFGWAICTVNDATGELVIVSDYGNWAHRWNTSPSALGHPTLTAFLAERGGVDYLARKLQGSRGGERFSAEKTAIAIGRLIAQRRLEDGREQWENRWDDDFPIPAHVRGYDERGLPINSYRRSRRWVHDREPVPYLTRDAARELWDKVESVASDCGDSPDLFLERLPRELYEIVEEPWNELQHEQTPGDRALRDLILPALFDACGAQVAEHQSDTPLTVHEARAVLVADDAMALSFAAREETGNTLGLAESDAWQLMVASAKRRIARFEGGAADDKEGSRR